MSFSAISRSDPADPEAAEQLTDALVMLFDAVMTTFRWTDVPGTEPTALERRISQIAEARA